MSTEVVITNATRTPIGNFNGAFANFPAHMLGQTVIRSLLEASNTDPKDVSEVIMGQVLTAACGQNPARQASISSGLPQEIPAWTVNQVCGSGLKSVALGAQSILCGNNNIVIAGGQENMSLAPHAATIRNGIKMGDMSFMDTMVTDGLWDAFNDYHMGITAENIANKFNISRQEQDTFACHSQNKAEQAQKDGAFQEEITPVTISTRKGEVTTDSDEFPRYGTTIESLAKLRPAFTKDGTITAGNASGINDGAAALLLMNASTAKGQGLTPMAKIVSFGQAGVDPALMGTGPINASKQALAKANWTVDDLDLVEANEAFAAQALCVNNEMGWDINKVNINGGAIALGHPIGASGTRILVTLLHAMRAQEAKKGLATLCVGGGMGVAICIERID